MCVCVPAQHTPHTKPSIQYQLKKTHAEQQRRNAPNPNSTAVSNGRLSSPQRQGWATLRLFKHADCKRESKSRRNIRLLGSLAVARMDVCSKQSLDLCIAPIMSCRILIASVGAMEESLRSRSSSPIRRARQLHNILGSASLLCEKWLYDRFFDRY